MTRAQSLIREAHKAIADLLQFYAGSVLFAQALAAVIFPAVEALLKQVTTTLPNYVWIIIYGIHLIIGVYAFYGFNKVKDFLKAAKLDEIEQEILNQKELVNKEQNKYEDFSNEVRTSLKSLVSQSVTTQAAISVLQGLTRDNVGHKPDAKEVEKLLAPLVEYRAESLQFSSSEKYNFAVYYYDKVNNVLTLYYRNCDSRITRHDRSWKVGVGHVGLAFAQEKTLISADVSRYEEFLGTGSLLETDKSVYVSFISTPIFYSKDHDTPWGVLVITSDRAKHFTKEYKIFVETLALILGIYFTINNN